MKTLWTSILLCFVVLGGAAGVRAQSEITLVTPAPTRVAFDKAIAAFESKTGNKVTVTNGTSLGTRDQATKGDAFDIFVMQAPYPEALASGNIVPGSGRTIASFVVGVGVRKGAPKPDISTPEAFKKLLLSAKAITYPDPAAGSAGVRVNEAFKNLGITDEMKAKSAIVANSGPAQASVASGEKDFCLAYISDMRNPGVDVVGPMPKEVAGLNDMVGFLSTHAKDPAAAKALLDYMSSPEVAAMYREAGMQPGH